MTKVFLGDIVKRVKDRVDKNNTGLKYYVAGEHFDIGEITISKKGVIQGSTIGPAFQMRFRPGHVLLMSRNPHLRKAGVVNFEGICSDVSYVCETKNESILKQSFLPFLFQTDDFWTFAEANKKGSTNFFLNWSDFERYEFNLPDIKEQEKLAELLWAAYDTKDSYKRLLVLTDDLVKSQFTEIFGDILTNPMGWPIVPLGEIANTRLGKMLDAKKQTGEFQYPYLANFNVQWFRFELSNLNQMDFTDKDRAEFSLQKGDLLVCEGGEVGRAAIWNEEIKDCYFQKALHRIRCKTEILTPEYLAYIIFMRASHNGFEDIVGKSTIPHLTGEKLKKLEIMLPPINLQNQFATFMQQTNRSKYELQQTILTLENTVRSLMKQYVG
ncbi:MAG TPA: restriction endonuclease subunit S [Patescibacteria group bacterium]|nr:restriction endonuclease subunit S [Patescibacteria group bacterium]